MFNLAHTNIYQFMNQGFECTTLKHKTYYNKIICIRITNTRNDVKYKENNTI